jgi:uncharacterized protein (DUF58 family)
MKRKGLIALACLVAGIPTAAYGLTHGAWLLILVGLALVLAFIYLAFEWIAGASKPMGAESAIKPSPNAAWSMKDQPVRPAGQDNEKN